MPRVKLTHYRIGRAAWRERRGCVKQTRVRFEFDAKKSAALRRNPRRGVSFEEVQEIWRHPYYLDQRSDAPEQFRAIGWVHGKLYSVIFECREDREAEYYHLVTLWKATKEEEELYERTSTT